MLTSIKPMEAAILNIQSISCKFGKTIKILNANGTDCFQTELFSTGEYQ